MAQELNSVLKKYTKTGIIAGAVVIVTLLGVLALSAFNKNTSLNRALDVVSENAANAADLRIAVISMDKIQSEAKALKSLHEQRTAYETKLKARLEKEQKVLEKEKSEIEKSQDMLSQEALQRRVVDYQRRVNAFQRDISESAQAIEVAYQEALSELQKKHLDPVIEGVIAKKDLSLVIDGRMTRVGKTADGLDITGEIIEALNKKVSSFKMPTPKGF